MAANSLHCWSDANDSYQKGDRGRTGADNKQLTYVRPIGFAFDVPGELCNATNDK